MPENIFKNKDKDFRAVIAIDGAGEVHILDITKDCDDVDLFAGGREAGYNGVEIHGDIGEGCTGLYHVRLEPWAHRDYEGEYDCGIDATLIEKLAECPYNFLDKKTKE